MYQIKVGGVVRADGSQAQHAIAKIEPDVKNDPNKQAESMELWCDGRYCGQIVWTGTHLTIHWTGD